MKNKTVRFNPQKRRFKVTGFALSWVLAFIIAVIFTQALRNSVSYIFFIIVCALPFIDLLYTLAASASVASGFRCSAEQTEKNKPVEFSVTLSNRFIFPLPFVEAELMLPVDTGASSSDTYVRIPLSPLENSEYKKTVIFPYKGEYSCGVKNVYVGGLFRFFRIKLSVNKTGKVTVLPRRILSPFSHVNTIDNASSSNVSGADRAEITEIKEYAPGDQMRNIHWKLSTKAQELLTKHFGSENGALLCVVADHGDHYALDTNTDPDINEFCDDAVCELCCAVLSSSLYEGKKASLIYNDTHKNRGAVERKQFDALSLFDDFLPYYAACGAGAPVGAQSLLEYCEEDSDKDVVFISSRLTGETAAALCRTQSINRSVSLILFEPYAKLKDPTELQKATDVCLRELAAADVTVYRINEKELV